MGELRPVSRGAPVGVNRQNSYGSMTRGIPPDTACRGTAVLAGSATRCKTAEAVGWSVMTCGQRRHAASPSCACHRQFGRIEQSGSAETTGSTASTTFSTRWHRPDPKCAQAELAHGAAKRKTSVGDTPFVKARSCSVTGKGSGNSCRRGCVTVPRTIPIVTLPFHSGCALGQDGFSGATIRKPIQRISPQPTRQAQGSSIRRPLPE